MILPALLVLLLLVLLYAWVGYPFILKCLPPRPSSRRSGPPALPRAEVLLAAHNEEQHVRQRIENLLALEYPREKLAVRVGVDASTDATADEARAGGEEDRRVRVHVFDERRGKVAVLKDLAARCRGGEPGSAPEVLVFTDANTLFAEDALSRLVSHFEDPAVGGVCGRLVFRDHERGRKRENAYWLWETRLKTLESRRDSCLGANGAIYAVRGELFPRDVPDNTIVDDFVIGMKVREQGYRMVYEPEAVACEDTPDVVSDEWRRRVRIGAGDYQALALCRRCLRPEYGVFAWMFWSHKVLRWFTPHLLLLLLALAAPGALAAVRGRHAPGTGSASLYMGLSALVWAGMLCTLACSAAGRLLRKGRHPVAALCRLCAYFVVMQAAIFAGFLQFCRGDLKGYWSRTARSSSDVPSD